ncbi:MAG: 30S ribosomal protein S11 [Lentisphaerae bacterium]|nr:30S ribosomal protein S11 [Lentisphaerota bacterium]
MAEENDNDKSEQAADGSSEASGAASVSGDADSSGEGVEAKKVHKARGAKLVPAGVAHIRASFNNTMVSITDRTGAVIAWSSSGRAGFKGSRKSTAFAATVVAQEAARQAVGRGMREVEAQIQGAGAGRESAIRALQSSGLAVTMIRDVTPIPHNGCRARKRRRV